MKQKQSGVALIYVLMIFAIVTVMAVRILTDLQLNIEKNTRFLQQMQARHYAQGAENYLTVLLEADFASDKKNKKMIDHWFEAWADTGVTLDTDDGEITIQVLRH